MTWTEQAERQAGEAAELGLGIASIHTAAWRARVDPDATGGLAGAATALYAPTKALFGRGKPLPQDQVMIAETEDHEIAAKEMHSAATALRARVSEAYSAAAAALREALARARAARDHGARSAALADAERARVVMADCEVALDILADVISRLSYAAGCLRRVPDDLATTYEAAYLHLRSGGRLPRDGDFLTGTPATPDQRHHAMSR
jgi:hypothetical protein